MSIKTFFRKFTCFICVKHLWVHKEQKLNLWVYEVGEDNIPNKNGIKSSENHVVRICKHCGRKERYVDIGVYMDEYPNDGNSWVKTKLLTDAEEREEKLNKIINDD